MKADLADPVAQPARRVNASSPAVVLAIILASYLMIVLDIPIVITGLPKIRESLGFTGLSWVQNAYTLAFGGLLLLGARAGDLLGRRRMFIVGLGNLPIGVLLMVGAQRHIAETPRRAGQLDLAGAGLSTLGMVALVYGLVQVASDGWGDAGSLGPLVAGVVLVALFLLNEARAPQPILPLRLFASRQRAGAYAARVLFLGGMIGFWFYTTQYLRGVLGMRPLQAGIAFLPATLVNFAVALAVPTLTRRFGNARLLAGGLAVSVLGMAWLGQVGPDTPYLLGVALPMVLIGAGQGSSLSPLTVAGVAGVAEEDAGAASGLVNVAHQVAASLTATWKSRLSGLAAWG